MSTTPIASRLLSHLIDRLGEHRWGALSTEQRDLVADCCRDAAELQLAVLAAEDSPALAAMIRREKAHVSAQLANLSLAGGVAVQTALWDVVSRLLVRTGAAILGRG